MLKYLSLSSMLLLNSNLFATNALYFEVNSSDDGVFMPIVLCLNGKGALSCQTYLVWGKDIFIKATAAYDYPNAGIRANADDYSYSGCTPYQNGYCIFRVDNLNYTNIKLIKKN